MKPITKHYLAFIPSGLAALLGATFVWTGSRLIDLSLWLEREYPKP